jgi:hypothetical protein
VSGYGLLTKIRTLIRTWAAEHALRPGNSIPLAPVIIVAAERRKPSSESMNSPRTNIGQLLRFRYTGNPISRLASSPK